MPSLRRALTPGSVLIMAAVAVVSLMPVPAAGQTPAASRWTPARLPDGRPDMQGLWIPDTVGVPAHSVEDGNDPDDYVILGTTPAKIPRVIVEPADGRIPYQPAAAAKRTELLRGIFTPTEWQHVDPHVRALLDGVPRNNYAPGGLQIGQVPGYLMILYESNHAYRVIPMNGSPHPGQNIKLWMGDSRGRWEENTLVIDVTNFNEGTWFDAHGSFHSDALHVVERWTMVSADRIEYEATIEDPKVFTSPWKIALTINRRTEKGYEQWEDTRHEGERDAELILLGGRRDKDAGLTGIHEHRRAR